MAHRARWSNEFLASEKEIPDKFEGRDAASYQRQVGEHANFAARFLDVLLKRKKEQPGD
jgi:hypothetical protein